MEEMRTHGTIRLSFSLPRVSFSPESGGLVKIQESYEGDEDTWNYPVVI
jgi:hypothetical protein